MLPESATFFNHWISTIPWLWGGAGLAGLAVARAARQGAYAAWLGWASLVLGGVTALFLISPLQYMAGMTGPVWLVVVAAGLLRSRPGVLGCSTGTVESNTSRGLAALRRLAVDTALAG